MSIVKMLLGIVLIVVCANALGIEPEQKEYLFIGFCMVIAGMVANKD